MPLLLPLATDSRSDSASTKAHFHPIKVAARSEASPTTPPPITIRSYKVNDGDDGDSRRLLASIIVVDVVLPVVAAYISVLITLIVDE